MIKEEEMKRVEAIKLELEKIEKTIQEGDGWIAWDKFIDKVTEITKD